MILHDPSVAEFEKAINSGRQVLVDFWAAWCGPCRAETPIVEKLEKECDVDLIKIDVDKDGELVEKFAISSIPTLVLYAGGKIIKKYVGLTSFEELAAAFGK